MLVLRRVAPNIEFVGTHFNLVPRAFFLAWIQEKGPVTEARLYPFIHLETRIVAVKCLSLEYNELSSPGLEPGPLDPASSATTFRQCELKLFVIEGYSYERQKPTLLPILDT